MPAPGGTAVGDTRGTLYVVATPIGNLGDVTLRALEVLRSVAVIAAEDTRITRRLLARYDIETRLVSYHARSGPGRLAELLATLAGGADVALTTDAGTPIVSDPGEDLVAAWGSDGGRVVPLPGPSAALAAVMATGIAGPQWTFEGFLPRRGTERQARLARIASDERGSIVFEAANRLGATLADLADVCADDRPGAVCREITKLHEQIARGSVRSLAAQVADGSIPARGEVVIVIGWAPASPRVAAEIGGPDHQAALEEVERLVEAGHGRSDAARRVAAATGIPRRRLYRPGAG